MPLKRGAGRNVIAENVRRELRAGKSQDEAVAIALDEARRTSRRGEKPPPYPKRKRAAQARKNKLARRRGYCSICRGPHKYKHGRA